MHYFILFNFTVSLMIFPAGSVFGIPVKIFLFIACFLSLWLQSIKYKIEITRSSLRVFNCLILLVLFMYFIGVLNGNKYAIDELKYLLVVLATVFILIVLSQVNVEIFLRAIFWGTMVYAIIKFVIYVGIFVGFLSIEDVLSLYMSAFDERFVYMPIYTGIYRIQLPPDIIYAFAPILYISISKKYNFSVSFIKIACIFFAASFVVFTAYSRYLFFVFAVMILLSLHNFLPRYKKVNFIIISGLIFIVFFNFKNLSSNKYFEERFSARNNQYSDEIRVDQQSKLIAKWLQSPIIGSGAGYYFDNYVRAEKTPFSYEAQILGYLMKGGVIFLFPLMVFSAYFVRCVYINSGVGISGLLILLLLSGFTNPYLTSTATAVLYAAFYLLGSDVNKKIIRRFNLV